MSAFVNYKATVLGDGPFAFYLLNETSGTTVFDSSPNGYNGTLNGGITLNQGSLLKSDTTDKSMLFDGTTGYISLPAGVSTNGLRGFSAECWVNVPNTYGGNNPRFLANSFGGSSTGGIQLAIKGSGNPQFPLGSVGTVGCVYATGSTFINLNAPSPITFGAVTYLVTTWDGATIRLYINGSQVAATGFSGSIGPGNMPMNIGRNPAYTGDYTPGNFQAVAFYPYALSTGQVSNHYNAGLAVSRTFGARLRLTFPKVFGARTRVSGGKVTKTFGARTRLYGLGSGNFGCWANGTGTASFDHFRATTYPDPSMVLAPAIPRLGTSLVGWTANQPANTTLGIDLSTDGVNWTEVSAGTSTNFDGSTGYVSLPTTGLPTGAAPWSLECWCMVGSLPSLTYNALVGMGNRQVQKMGVLYIKMTTSTTGQFMLGTFAGDIVSGPSIVPNVPYHVVGTYDGSQTRLYVNGVLVGAPATFAVNLVQAFASIGADGPVQLEYFPGTIGEVAFYSTTLSAAKILNHYQIGAGLTSPTTYRNAVLADSPIRYYRLNDTNTTAIDLGSQAQNGTINGVVKQSVPGLIKGANGLNIPLFYPQPDPTVDGFSVNSAANYTSTFRTGGAASTWTYDTANSRLVATGGTNGIFVYNAISRADIDVFSDLDQADAGGLIWRYNDQSDFYLLTIADSRASVGTPNTVTLYRVVANVQTQLGSASISFLRGMYHRFRVVMLGSLITVTMDGATVINTTDGSPLATAGLVGMYNNGGTVGSRYYQLWITPQGDNVSGTPAGDIASGTYLYTRQRLSTTDPTATPQLLDLTTMVGGPNIRAGTQLESVMYSKTRAYIGKALDDLAKASNYAWYIGVDSVGNKTINFRPPSLTPAPWILQSTPPGVPSDFEHDGNHAVETAANQLYRNRQVITGATGTSTFSDTFAGDGVTTSFTLRYPLASGFTPTITLNGVVQTVGLKGTTGSQWYYAPGDPVISQDALGLVLQGADTLFVPLYQGTFLTTITVDNLAAQAALAAIEKSSGIVENVEDVSLLEYDVPTATTYAQNLLSRYCITGRTVTFKTYRSGLEVLQILTAFIPEYNLVDAQLLITEIDIDMKTQPGGTVLYGYIVTASELAYIKSWSVLLSTSLLIRNTAA